MFYSNKGKAFCLIYDLLKSILKLRNLNIAVYIISFLYELINVENRGILTFDKLNKNFSSNIIESDVIRDIDLIDMKEELKLLCTASSFIKTMQYTNIYINIWRFRCWAAHISLKLYGYYIYRNEKKKAVYLFDNIIQLCLDESK